MMTKGRPMNEDWLILTWHLSATGWNSSIEAHLDGEPRQTTIADLGHAACSQREAQDRALAWAEGMGWHKAGRWSGPRLPRPPHWPKARWVRVER